MNVSYVSLFLFIDIPLFIEWFFSVWICYNWHSTSFFDPNLSIQIEQSKITRSSIDRYSIIVMAGIGKYYSFSFRFIPVLYCFVRGACHLYIRIHFLLYHLWWGKHMHAQNKKLPRQWRTEELMVVQVTNKPW